MEERNGVLCDYKIPLKLKQSFSRNVIRPSLLYDIACCTIKRSITEYEFSYDAHYSLDVW